MTNRYLALVAGAAALAIMGWSNASYAQDAALIAAAKKEGTLVWYTGFNMANIVRPLAAGFEKKYGITVKYAQSADVETVLRLTNELRTKSVQTDVFDSPGTTILAGIKAGFIENYIVQSAKDWPEGFNDPKGSYSSVFALPQTATYNTDLVKPEDAPKTYDDLLDPKWKGKMVWTDSRASSGLTGFIGHILRLKGQEKGMEYLRKLATQNIAAMPTNSRTVLDQVIVGEYPIGLLTYIHHTQVSREKGAPIAWIKMEPLSAHVSAFCIVKNAPHPNAAKLFMEYLFSEEAQIIFRDQNYPIVHPHLKPKVADLSPPGNYQLAIQPINEHTEADLAAWTKVAEELFRK